MIEKELIDRPIPGITVKQIIMLATFFAGCVAGYIDIKNGQTRNYALMAEMKEEFKHNRVSDEQKSKLYEARFQVLELQINELKVRLTILDKFLEGYNKQK